MSEYLLYWLVQAEVDLAKVWMESRFRNQLTDALNEVEEQLRREPHRVGRGGTLSKLSEEDIRRLLARLSQLPESLRTVNVMGVDMHFFIAPDTRIVFIVRLEASES
jgi:hypothetical protein